MRSAARVLGLLGRLRLGRRRRRARPGGHRSGPVRAVGTVALVVFCLLLALAPTRATPVALAHAQVVRSDPADGAVLEVGPSTVRVTFNEPIEREFYALELYTDRRVRVDRRDVRMPADDARSLQATAQDLGPGVYTVVWRVLSIDGHVVRGAYTFAVGVGAVAPTPATLAVPGGPEPAFVLGAVIRWWTYLAAFAVAGGCLFGPLVLWPALATPGAAGGAAGSTGVSRARTRAGRAFGLTAWPAAISLVVLTLAALVVQAADVTGAPLGDVLTGRAISRLLTGTKYGELWLARFGLVLVIPGALAMAAAVPAGATSGLARRGRLAGAALAAGLLLALAATGHASGVARLTAVAIGADWVHLLAAAIWVGGLLQLLIALPPALAALDTGGRRAVLAVTIRRFSVLAGGAVVVLSLTGVYAGLLHVPAWQALLDSAYGAALSGKLMLIVPLLALAAINLLVLHPRFVRAVRGATSPGPTRPEVTVDDGAGRRLFRWLVAGEVALVALILGVTGILTGLPPASQIVDGQPVRETRTAGDLQVALRLDPNRAGANSFRVELTDASGAPVLADDVALELSHRSMDMGLREVPLQAMSGGRYEGGGGQLSMSGPWDVAVVVRRTGTAVARVDFPVAVGESAGAGRQAFSPARILLYSLSPQLALGGIAVVLAGMMLATQRRRPRRRGRPLMATGAALALIGVVAGSGAVVSGYRQSLASAAPLVNPFTATPETLAAGRLVYEQNCLACHGVQGRGDGPAARAYRPPPADLQVHMAAGHTDGQLFEWISKGVAGTAMPAFAERLSEDDRWRVLTYIRTLASGGGGS